LIPILSNVDVTDCGTTAEMISKAALDIQNVGCDDEAFSALSG